MNQEQKDQEASLFVRRHLQIGWWSLLCFLSLGLLLELLHGFKVSWYLEPEFTTRRLMWTLGHAHGTLLSLVHLGFAATIHILPVHTQRARRFASPCLTAASIFLPMGFLLGGVFIYEGDPGWGILLVPVGALLLLISVFRTALAVTSFAKTE